jgi:hypothetical protein
LLMSGTTRHDALGETDATITGFGQTGSSRRDRD